MNLYVGNLSYDLSEGDLQDYFSEFGQVQSTKIIKDFVSGKSKGFGFIEMSSQEEGENAISQTNGKELNGRTLKVNQAFDRNNNRRPSNRGGY